MRALFIGPLIAVGLLLVLGVAVVPNLIDADGYRADIAAGVEALTGRELRIHGEVGLSLLPQPTLTVTGASLADGAPEADAEAFQLVIDRLDLQLAALPLLRGELRPLGVRLVRPVLTVELPPAAAADSGLLPLLYASLRDAGGPPPVAGGMPERIVVADGELVIAADDAAAGPPSRRFDRLNFDLSAESAAGPFVLAGDFRDGDRLFSLAVEVGQLDARRGGPLRLELAGQGPDGSTAAISYGGVVRFGPEGPELSGGLEVEGNNLGRSAALLGALLDGGEAAEPAPPSAGLLGDPFALAGELELSSVVLTLDELAVEVGEDQATGHLAVGLAAAEPRLDLELRIPELELVEISPAMLRPAAWPLPPAGLRGTVAVTVTSVVTPDAPIRRLRLALALPGDGRVVVDRASAVLPGNTDIGFTGAFGPVPDGGGAPLLSGSLEAATDDLRTLLDWLGPDTSGVPRGRLRTLTFAGDLALAPALLKLSRAELRFDASTLAGSMALGLGPRPRLAVAASLDRFNADAYLPGLARRLSAADEEEEEGTVAGSWPGERWREIALALDTAADIRVEQLTWDERRLGGVHLRGRLENGVAVLDELTVADLAELRLRVGGEADLVEERIDLEFELGTAHPVRSLRLLGHDPPPMLASFAPVRLTGTAVGPLDAAAFELDVGAGELELALSGEAALRVAAPLAPARLDAAWQAAHPALPDLLRQLGVLGVPEGELAGPVQLAGGLEVAPNEAFRTRFAGTVGPMAVDGNLTWEEAEPRPRLRLDVSAEPLVGELLATLAATGTPGRGSPFAPGNLSRRPLNTEALRAADLELDLATEELRYGGRSLGPLALAAALQDGALELRRLDARPFGGKLEARARLTTADEAPLALELGLDLDGVEAGPLLELFEVPPALRGPADLRFTARSAGRSPFDLVGNLDGEMEIRIRGGRLAGVDLAPVRRALEDGPELLNMARLRRNLLNGETPFALFGGILDLERGILRATELGAMLEEGGVGTVDGIIDFVFWAGDLTVELIPDGSDGLPSVGVRVVGPLDDPQTVPRLGDLEAYLAAKASGGEEDEGAGEVPAPQEE